MGEWPQTLHVDRPGDPYVEVIPADLGRSLADAVETYLRNEPHMSAEHCLGELEAALARYEREVGE